MKLYATTTSERASKGQGGNLFLDIELTYRTSKGENLKFLKLEILPQNDGIEVRYTMDKTIAYLTEIKEQGNITCSCGGKFFGLEGKEDTCPSCLEKIIKGKRQKDNLDIAFHRVNADER